MSHFRASALSVIGVLGVAVSASASAQSALSNLLDKVGNGLNTVHQGLSVVSGQSPPAAALLSVRSMKTGIAPVQPGTDNQSIMSGPVEIRFMQGRDPASVATFNDATPVIDKTLGILGCIRYRSAAQDEWDRAKTVILRYSVESGLIGLTYSGFIPMEGTRYHDENLCLAVRKVEVTIPAPTAVVLLVTFEATDSLEAVRVKYRYQRDYHGEWEFAEVGEIR